MKPHHELAPRTSGSITGVSSIDHPDDSSWLASSERPGNNHPPAADITWGDVKCLTSRAEIALVNTGTPITPENNLLSLLATITANSAQKAWLFRVSFLLPFFTRIPAHTLPNNNYTCWAQLMNPALFSVVTWEESRDSYF